MNHKQKKILRQAFRALVAGADEGRRLVEAGASIGELKKHAADLELLAKEIRKATEMAVDVEAVAKAHHFWSPPR